MLVGLPTAQAVDTTLTLACEGTTSMITNTTDYGDTGPVSMGLVVDVARRTVHGFREQFARDGHETELKITEVTEAILVLRGPTVGDVSVSGFMDRMSGDMTVTVSQKPPAAFHHEFQA
jgi:hypothetical protein